MKYKNYWDEFEYSKLKLLLNEDKVRSILDVRNGMKKMDQCFPISVELHLTDCCNLNCGWCTDKILRNNKATLELKAIESLFYEFGKQPGYYKYTVFDQDISEETEKVFNNTDFGNEIEGILLDLPNSYWVAQHHKCAPIYYGWDKAELTVEEIREHLLG
ncbi:MAG: hypothetical protein K2P14_02690 [Anaeroplasmataceae bacterium]|nr:hypothetical protein [Anaeroplasmataceae bacterium]